MRHRSVVPDHVVYNRGPGSPPNREDSHEIMCGVNWLHWSVLTILACNASKSMGRLSHYTTTVKAVSNLSAKVWYSLGNPVGMDFKPLRQLGHRRIFRHCYHHHFSFKHRIVCPSRSFCHFQLHLKAT